MKVLFLILYLIIVTKFLVYKSTIKNFIRANDLRVYNYLVEQNTYFGRVYNLLKFFLFNLSLLYFFYIGINFILGFSKLKENEIFLGFLMRILPFMLLLYCLYLIISKIQKREFVFIDEIFKIVISTYLLNALSILEHAITRVPTSFLKNFFLEYSIENQFKNSFIETTKQDSPPTNPNLGSSSNNQDLPSSSNTENFPSLSNNEGLPSLPSGPGNQNLPPTLVEVIPERLIPEPQVQDPLPVGSETTILGEIFEIVSNLLVDCNERTGPDLPTEGESLGTSDTTYNSSKAKDDSFPS